MSRRQRKLSESISARTNPHFYHPTTKDLRWDPPLSLSLFTQPRSLGLGSLKRTRCWRPPLKEHAQGAWVPPRRPPGARQSGKQALLAQDPIPGLGGWQDNGKDQRLCQHVGGLPGSPEPSGRGVIRLVNWKTGALNLRRDRWTDCGGPAEVGWGQTRQRPGPGSSVAA